MLLVTAPTDALDRASRNVAWLRVVRPGQVTVTDVLRHERMVCERDALMALQETLLA
ncbi:MAG: 50S ribosomal protein L4 [Candidatus Rokuibacteriota bacterium]